MIDNNQTSWFELEPIDAWFFRASRPSNQGEDQSDLESLFPPHPPTVVGALRAGLARRQGWNGQGAWPNDLKPILGDGFQDLGALKFVGPFLRQKGTEMLYPVPRHVIGHTRDTGEGKVFEPTGLLRPGEEPVNTDAGPIHLPEAPPATAEQHKGKAPEAPEGFFVTDSGMERILFGKLPSHEQFVHARSLYCHESRVGIQRDPVTKTTGENALYSPSFVRLEKGVSLTVGIAGLPPGWTLPSVFPLGGESRLASCTPLDKTPTLPGRSPRSGRVLLALLAPARFDSGRRWWGAGPGDSAPDLSGAFTGAVVSAAIDRPTRIGGWDSLNRRPVSVAPYVPAGSVWWLEDASVSSPGNALPQLGTRTAYGFGTTLLGEW